LQKYGNADNPTLAREEEIQINNVTDKGKEWLGDLLVIDQASENIYIYIYIYIHTHTYVHISVIARKDLWFSPARLAHPSVKLFRPHPRITAFLERFLICKTITNVYVTCIVMKTSMHLRRWVFRGFPMWFCLALTPMSRYWFKLDTYMQVTYISLFHI
jgi:hypothetical protein